MKTAAMWLPLLVFCSLSCCSTVIAQVNQKLLTSASTKFTKDLLQVLVQNKPGNVIVSPISISSLLAMLQQGAKNVTAEQLETVLYIAAEPAASGFGNLVQTFTKRKYKSKLEFNNKIFVSSKISILPEYKEVLSNSFHAAAESVQFNNARTAAQSINHWVATTTKNRITNLVNPATLSAKTQLVLANTIYFKGVWRELFPANATTDEEFTLVNGQKIIVPMMNLKARMDGGSNKMLGALWVELPYDGDDFGMILVLPDRHLQLDQVISRLTHEDFNSFLQQSYPKEVTLKMPRFKLSQETPIIPALQKLGLTDIFSQRSDLAGISSNKLQVTNFVHKAEIEVNEEGTVASASSAVFVNTLSASPNYETITFSANQPFLAIIIDKQRQLPVFFARVANPLLN